MANPVNPDDALLNDYFGSLSPEWVSDAATDGRRFVVVPVPKLYGDSLFGAQRGVALPQGANCWLQLVLYAPQTGGPLTISVGPYSSPPTVEVRYREATGVLPTVWIPAAAAELAADGRSVLLPVPVEVVDVAGVYRFEVMVRDAAGAERARDGALLLVDRGLWLSDGTAPANDVGPPTVIEVRTALRDHPGANRLLGEFEFPLAEIGAALTAAVQQYNGEFPPLPRGFSTRNFPILWRRPWVDGTLARLFETAGIYHRRGMLPYSAGGLQVNDLAKEKDYIAAAQFYQDRYTRFVRLKRSQINIEAAWGSVAGGLYTRGPLT